MASYYDPAAISAFYAQQQSLAEAAAQRQAEILLQQYERSVAAQKEARAQQEAAALAGYNSLLDAAKARYDNALAQRQQSYDKAVGDVNGASERAMQQAYLSSELQKRNIGQQLAALGRSGGASETTLLNMANSYGNARGTIDQNRTSQLGALASDLAAGKASDLDTYNNAKAGYDYDYQNKLADLANTSQEKLLGYSNTYANGLAQLEQSKAQQLAQLQSAQNDALMQAQAAQAASMGSGGSARAGSGGGGSYTAGITKSQQSQPKVSGGVGIAGAALAAAGANAALQAQQQITNGGGAESASSAMPLNRPTVTSQKVPNTTSASKGVTRWTAKQ
ncbi:MAG: hypothetical protein HDT26_12765 [Subdoligranulum sp.]|nr:hypothetical protein [Subdoligranulum sp.]